MNPFEGIRLDEPPMRLDVDALMRQGRVVRARRRLTVSACAAVAAVAVAGGGLAIGAAVEPDTVSQRPAGIADASALPVVGGPSQSAADAERDGVPPAVAALPVAERVGVVDSTETPEGVWAVSRMPGGPGVLGDATGRYGIDWVQRAEYGELVLLDPTRTRVLRAVPLPGVPPQTLLVRDDAVYCARQGDGGLPNSMLCRADRQDATYAVRVFRSGGPDPQSVPERPGWVQQPAPAAVFDDVVDCAQGLCARGAAGERIVDPVTLVLTEPDGFAPGDAEARRLVGALRALASGSGSAAAAALPFAPQVRLGLGRDLLLTRTSAELVNESAWAIDQDLYAGYNGPFNALDLLRTPGDYNVLTGPHAHCAGAPRPAPTGLEDTVRVSTQPTDVGSCLGWYTVDLFLRDDLIVAITVDLFEP